MMRMNIKKTFVNLTSKTYPYGYEYDLVPFLPRGCQEDEDGNFFLKIGESKTIFASHLDTCCNKQVDVKHIFDGKYIKTNGKSILGADDKAGVTILLYLIENKVPGLYYFFVGEEVGCIGSGAASKRKEFFEKYNRMISFDRRGTKSVITYQSSKRSCSNAFADSLISQYKKWGMYFEKDETGVYTDSAEFTTIIPECTNISVGYYDEHTNREKQDITHLEDLASASVAVDWESLVTDRDPDSVEWKSYGKESYDEYMWGEDWGYGSYNGGYSGSRDAITEHNRQHCSTRRAGRKNRGRYNDDREPIVPYPPYKPIKKQDDFIENKWTDEGLPVKRSDITVGNRKIYLDSIDNEIELFNNSFRSKAIVDYQSKEKINDRNSKNYYEGVKNLFLSDELNAEEYRIIKEQYLDENDENDKDYMKYMSGVL